MARAVTIGNGNLLVGLDDFGHVRDFYYPHAGHANHVSGASGSYSHRIGVYAEGKLRWLNDGSWHVTARCQKEQVVSDIHAVNDEIGVELTVMDAVYNERDVFIRKILVGNSWEREREIKLYFGQEFRISESRRGDTAYFDPRVGAIIHYKGRYAFLVNAKSGDNYFTEYSVGLFDSEGKSGTYRDAEDGVLSKNSIEHGSVDSVIGLTLTIPGHQNKDVDYWVAAGRSIKDVHELDAFVREEEPQRLVVSTQNYWKAWLEKESKNLSVFDGDLRTLYKQSLAIIRVHTDNKGGIIASSDSDMLNQGRDTYSYVWPRDSAISANALDRGGYHDASQRYFSFIADRIEEKGFLMHKYRVDGVLGSSWHPWVRDGKEELPIQEDETALTIYQLAKHYELTRDVEFIESVYNRFVEPASQFMCQYIDAETGLPQSSYDLWEEKYGVSTYTAAAVSGALGGAAELASLLGKREHAKKYRARAEQVKKAILGYLYDQNLGMFVKLVRQEEGRLVYDRTVDISSFHGMVYFGLLPPEDERIKRAAEVVKEKLKVPTEYGGYMRYEGDNYYRTVKDAPPNAWIITTLWMAQYVIQKAKTRAEMQEAYDILRWVFDRARKSGILPEQVHPFTGQHLSTAPLTWSHAEFVATIDEYLKKYNALS